jgi:hypothetical protein
MGTLEMKGRIFTFGCSFTRYLWPTWADIINFDLDNEFHNWGICGIGNIAILHKMLECDLKHQFNSNDIILVNWSSWHREDRLANHGRWLEGGNIFNNPTFDKAFIKDFWNEHNDIVKNTSAIIMANKMFNINFQSHMTDFDTYIDVSDDYKYLFDNLPNTVMFDKNNNSRFDNKTWDSHPDVICHINHVNTIYNSIGSTINPSTVDHFNKLQERIVTELTDTDIDMSWDKKVKLFTNLIGFNNLDANAEEP